MTGRDDGLWSYAVALHGREGVEQACLLLQDEAGADVLLLLTACYAAADLDAPLCGDDIRDLEATIAAWRSEVIEPLRTLRQRLKPVWPGYGDGKERFRDRVKALEREAESLQVARIEAWLAARPPVSPGLPLPDALQALCGAATSADITAARQHLAEAAMADRCR